MATFFEAFTNVPFCRTLPVSQAAAAIVLVLNKRMAHRYLSILSLSFSAIGSKLFFYFRRKTMP
jgi:hypothetical protein